MSRIAKSPVTIPGNVDITLTDDLIKVKGTKGELKLAYHRSVSITKSETDSNVLNFKPKTDDASDWSFAGTTRSLVNNMICGVTEGFQKTLELIGVGYRVQVQGNKAILSLGFSHPVEHILPEGISAEVVKQTKLILSGVDKQKVGQVAADIRAYRPPEPYKGKGVRYSDEQVVRKEAKKK